MAFANCYTRLLTYFLFRHVLVRIAALPEVDIVFAAEMSDGVRELIDARLSQRFHEVVERGGEKLTRVHKYDVADLQQHVSYYLPASSELLVVVNAERIKLRRVKHVRSALATRWPNAID